MIHTIHILTPSHAFKSSRRHPAAIMDDVQPNHVDGHPAGKCTDVTGETLHSKVRDMRRQAIKSKLTRSGHNAAGWDERADAYKHAS